MVNMQVMCELLVTLRVASVDMRVARVDMRVANNFAL